MTRTLWLLAALVAFSGCAHSPDSPDPEREEWVELFNGKDLDDWIIKIGGHPVGENALNTFSVEDGKLVVRYDRYDSLDDRYGHVFYQQPFSHYRIRIEYRFVGEQVSGAPDWAWRNNGIMYHAQSPHDMALDQGYPACMEVQLLGGNGEEERPTSNLVTPGSQAVYRGQLREDHIIESSSKTYHGDQWVSAELEVHGDELAIHRVEGEEVLRYSGMQLDDGTPLTEGYIALQAESHPIEFRSVRLLNLKGCTDPEARNYKSYRLKHEPGSCQYD